MGAELTVTIERIGSCAICENPEVWHGKFPTRKDNLQCGFKFYIKSSTTEIPLNTNTEITKIEFANLIPITQGDVIPTEFTIEIQGQCNKCGFCCGYRNKKLQPYGCSHIITTGNKKGECAIYDYLADWCDEHQKTHTDCVPAINQPVKKFNPDCGYSFVVTTPGLVITGQEIIYFEVANFTGHLTEGQNIRI